MHTLNSFLRAGMPRCKIDRTTMFLCVVFVLFLYDLAYVLGFRDPGKFPHPFWYFRILGDVEFLRGFPGILRQLIFFSVLGGLIGVGFAHLILRNPPLAQAAISVLRLGLWLPLLVVFATPDAFALGIAAALLCGAYRYLVGISVLNLAGSELRAYIAGEITLQVLLFSLIAQIWLRSWNWYAFAGTYELATGLGVMFTLTILLSFFRWIFNYDFDLATRRCAAILDNHVSSKSWISVAGFLLFALILTLLWEFVLYLRSPDL